MFNEEGLLNKIVTAAVIGLLGWLVVTTQQMSVQQAVVATKLEGVESLIVAMQSTYMTKAEADLRIGVIERELTRMRDTLRAVVLSQEEEDAVEQ